MGINGCIMKIKYILVILLLASLAGAPDMPRAGSLLPFADALEDMADMSRSADRAHESMRNAMNGGYYHDYDRDCCRDYYRDKEHRKRWHKPPHPYWSKKYYKHHKKYYKHYKKRHHHDDDDDDD